MAVTAASHFGVKNLSREAGLLEVTAGTAAAFTSKRIRTTILCCVTATIGNSRPIADDTAKVQIVPGTPAET